uniref:Uncharacterized protein n=1 Tax=Peronospora matthiolae TaxID=2874970 RepID=A0AAV1U8U0_9STRA
MTHNKTTVAAVVDVTVKLQKRERRPQKRESKKASQPSAKETEGGPRGKMFVTQRHEQ